MAKKTYTCFNCGKVFARSYELMLHYDFHRGEPVVREAGCVCAQDYDVRCGFCLNCGYIHSTGWIIRNGVAVDEKVPSGQYR